MIKKLKFYDGSVQQISEIPVNIRDKYKEVFEIPADWLIRTAAYRGKWIDQSQSLNIFMRGTNGKMLADAYSYAWRMGLKTTYYLRSLAASQVEKSTVDTAAFGDTHKRDFSSSAPVGNGMSMQMDSSVATQVSAQTMVATSQETLKVCSILDPDCEACQ